MEVRGKRVFDVGTGSGLVAIAAMKAGAKAAEGVDVDRFCAAAVGLNARANEVEVAFAERDPFTAAPPAAEVICAGDVFYEKPLADRAIPWLQAAKQAGARVLLGDPGRAFFPRSGLVKLGEYQVPTTRELEDNEIKKTAVWTFPA
jgi:predicted nicotinamide N-methyase